ncbi:MAG: DUF4340 domain-containing protein [Cellulosilyticaceae bacterium]
MHKKSWIVPIIVLFLCSTFMIAYQKNSDFNTYATSIEKRQISLNKSSSDIHSLNFSFGDFSIDVSRIDSDWILSDSNNVSAESSYIYSIINSFITPGTLHLLDIDTTDLSPYGITDFSPQITFCDENNTPYTFIQGVEYSPKEYYTYNPMTDALYTISKTAFDQLSRKSTDWLSKDYLNFNPEFIDFIELTYNDDIYTLRTNPIHNIKTFESSTLNVDDVQKIVSFLETTRASSYISTNISEQIYTSYGFAVSPLSIRIVKTDGSEELFLMSTTFLSDNGFYMMSVNDQTLFTISSFINRR